MKQTTTMDSRNVYDSGFKLGKQQLTRGAKILAVKARKAILPLLMKLLLVLLPYILVIIAVLGIIFFAYTAIYGRAEMIRDENLEGYITVFDPDDVLWSEEEDAELWERYIYLCALPEEFTECQTSQALQHKLPEGILAGIDRCTAEEEPKFIPNPEEHYEALQTYFEWNDSDAIVRSEVEFLIETAHPVYESYYITVENEDGTTSEEEITVFSHYEYTYHTEIHEGVSSKEVQLLLEANAFDGLYTYDYERQTEDITNKSTYLTCGLPADGLINESLDNARDSVSLSSLQRIVSSETLLTEIEQDVLVSCDVTNNFERFLSYLSGKNIRHEVDVEGILLLAALYDPYFETKYYENYQDIMLYDILQPGKYSGYIYSGYVIDNLIELFNLYGYFPIEQRYYNITSPYGQRLHPTQKIWRFHKGIDLAAQGISGSPVYAVLDGIVNFAGISGSMSKGYGNLVIINHGEVDTYYAHLQRINNVTNGTEVKAGQVIGYVGSTGDSTDPHLHFEIRYNGSPVDPKPYLDIMRD